MKPGRCERELALGKISEPNVKQNLFQLFSYALSFVIHYVMYLSGDLRLPVPHVTVSGSLTSFCHCNNTTH